MVEFNVEEETGFIASLEYLGGAAFDDVFGALQDIVDRKLEFAVFKDEYGWVRVDLIGQDTYPGADPLHWFVVIGASGVSYQIAAKGPYEAIVVCSVASVR